MSSKADGEWVASLANSRVGRQLATHLASVEVHTHGCGHTCACQEALGNERVFMKAMARSVYLQRPYPCGLSTKLPLYIAILNLSGERSLVYSDNPALMRCVCAHSEALNRLDLTRVLLTFEKYASERTDAQMKFVLLNYSMPWQCGTSAAYWHMSACSVNAGTQELSRTLDDRVLQFSSVAAAPFSGRSVIDPHETQILITGPKPAVLDLVADKQISDFYECYSATNLDFGKAAGVPKDRQNAQLLSVVQDLQKGRKEDQKEIDRLNDLCATLELDKRALKKDHAQAVDGLRTTHRNELEVEEEDKRSQEQLARQQYDGLLAEMRGHEATTKDMDGKYKRVRREHDQIVAKLADLERQGSAKDALHNAALSNHVATISKLEGRLSKALEKAASVRDELEKEHASRLEREGAAHQEALTKLITTIESKERIINQLSENNERRDVEVASLKTHADEQGKRMEVFAEKLRKAGEAEAAAKALAKSAQTSAKAPKAQRQLPPAAKTRSVCASTHNASTSTHQCASTQTGPEPTPEPAPAPASAVEAKVAIESVPTPTCSYQAAIDVLQQLVSISTNAPQPHMMVPVHPLPHSYPRPLPFPHFTPGHVPPYAFDPHGHPQYAPNYQNGRY
jgi:hypothetical protein